MLLLAAATTTAVTSTATNAAAAAATALGCAAIAFSFCCDTLFAVAACCVPGAEFVAPNVSIDAGSNSIPS